MNDLVPQESIPQTVERLLITGDLSSLKPEERVVYYKAVCTSVGLNPLTRPFEYITLNGKLQLYARKDCTDQLRQIHKVSVKIVARELLDDCYVVTAEGSMPEGRIDCAIGAVAVGGLKGDAKCNALMKAETKAKRRLTLSMCGLGMLDETEIETVPGARITSGAETPVEPVTFTRSPVQELKKKLEDETDSPYISIHQRSTLSKRFRESVNPKIEGDANILRHHALEELHKSGKFQSKLVDEKGNPTQDFILKTEYVAIGKALVEAAKELG